MLPWLRRRPRAVTGKRPSARRGEVMRQLRTTVLMGAALAGIAIAPLAGRQAPASSVKYVRYQVAGTTAFGILDGDIVRELKGDLFASPVATGRTRRLADVRLLAPVEPSKVIAVGLNYLTHLGERPAATYPGLFAKYPTSIVAHGDSIVIPPDARNVHYEGELVVVIGKRARNITAADARAHIFGVTCGNDVSERDWQRQDLQWFRAKASDTFAPLGPWIVTGLNYNDLLLQTRLNGEVVQSQRTKDLIFNVDEIVSYLSRYITLLPGDVIYTGTPGTTRAFKAGDVIEVEIEGIGVLRNPATAGK
jgi:2-keto-4-pentenoate hydratase/2-oxohepta-3-ene-1,7-dioic acid hydratase in catechol pathway